jgi:hypothetical protein
MGFIHKSFVMKCWYYYYCYVSFFVADVHAYVGAMKLSSDANSNDTSIIAKSRKAQRAFARAKKSKKKPFKAMLFMMNQSTSNPNAKILKYALQASHKHTPQDRIK